MPINCAKAPCKQCPYRKDAPLAVWGINHFRDLLRYEDREQEPVGKTYGCHKGNGKLCTGWVMNQYEREADEQHEVVAFRLYRMLNRTTDAELSKLRCPVPRYRTLEEMCFANFPRLISEFYSDSAGKTSGSPYPRSYDSELPEYHHPSGLFGQKRTEEPP